MDSVTSIPQGYLKALSLCNKTQLHSHMKHHWGFPLHFKHWVSPFVFNVFTFFLISLAIFEIKLSTVLHRVIRCLWLLRQHYIYTFITWIYSMLLVTMIILIMITQLSAVWRFLASLSSCFGSLPSKPSVARIPSFTINKLHSFTVGVIDC